MYTTFNKLKKNTKKSSLNLELIMIWRLYLLRYNGIEYSGIIGEIFEIMKRIYNFTYETVDSPDGFYGAEVRI